MIFQISCTLFILITVGVETLYVDNKVVTFVKVSLSY